MEYIELKLFSVEDLISLYDSVGWSAYTKSVNVMRNIIPNSLWWCVCVDDGELVGLIRVVGDGISIIYVQDILIRPNYHRKGIGSELMKRMLNKYSKVRQIVLTTENEPITKAFYESLGFANVESFSNSTFVRYNME